MGALYRKNRATTIVGDYKRSGACERLKARVLPMHEHGRHATGKHAAGRHAAGRHASGRQVRDPTIVKVDLRCR